MELHVNMKIENVPQKDTDQQHILKGKNEFQFEHGVCVT